MLLFFFPLLDDGHTFMIYENNGFISAFPFALWLKFVSRRRLDRWKWCLELADGFVLNLGQLSMTLGILHHFGWRLLLSQRALY